MNESGIICTECDVQMLFESEEIITTNPPKRYIKCPICEKEDTVCVN